MKEATKPPFSFSATTRVAFSDTDAQGIVYYGRYAPYFDLARVEYWRELGLSVHSSDAAYSSSDRTDLVMRAFNIEYHAPAVFDDAIEVFCRVAKLGNTSLTFEFAVVLAAENKLLATATQIMVNIDLEARRPVPIDDVVRQKIDEFEANYSRE